MLAIVQRDLVASRTRPARELVAFVKVRLDPGEQRNVRLSIPAERLGFMDEDAMPVQEPGEHRLWVTTGADPLGGTVLDLVVVA